MHKLIFLMPLLYGCSTAAVRCDAHLQPINPPAAISSPSALPENAPPRSSP